MPQDDLRKSNAGHLSSMDTSRYSTRAQYHLLHNASNYAAMTFPLRVVYKSDITGEAKSLLMVAIDENLDKLISDLKKIFHTSAALKLKIWVRSTAAGGKEIEKTVDAQNINHLFRFCVGQAYGDSWLEVIRQAPKPAIPIPSPIPLPVRNIYGRGRPYYPWNPYR